MHKEFGDQTGYSVFYNQHTEIWLVPALYLYNQHFIFIQNV